MFNVIHSHLLAVLLHLDDEPHGVGDEVKNLGEALTGALPS